MSVIIATKGSLIMLGCGTDSRFHNLQNLAICPLLPQTKQDLLNLSCERSPWFLLLFLFGLPHSLTPIIIFENSLFRLQLTIYEKMIFRFTFVVELPLISCVISASFPLPSSSI